MHAYEDPTLTPKERAEDLLARLSLDEKLGQVVCALPFPGVTAGLETTNPHGVGVISGLCLSREEDPVGVARRVRTLQEQAISLNPHGIPALLHIETLTGLLMIGWTVSFTYRRVLDCAR